MLEDAMLEQLPYWEQLTSPERDAVRAAATINEYDKGQVLFSRGCACMGMVYLLEGSVRVYVVSDEGREITLFNLNPGECCVLSASCVLSQITFETVMMAAEDCKVLVVPAGSFERLMNSNIHVRCFTFELLAGRASDIMWVLQQIIFLRFDQRLAGYLVAQVQETGSLEIAQTQEQIAQNVNSARETVARQLGRFAEDGLITMGRGRVRVLDLPGLQALR